MPDCIVEVQPEADLCLNENCSSTTLSPFESASCFCFEHSKECSSSSLYISQLPLPTDQFQLITLRADSVHLFSSQDALASSTTNRIYLHSADDGVQVLWRDFNTKNELAYFNLPPSHRGYQLLSYGGQIKYRLLYRGSGSSIRTPDVILRGNNITLFYGSHIESTEVSVPFLPEEWSKRPDSSEPSRREDLMMALQSIEYFLIRASYIENTQLDTTITDIRMDTATEHNDNQGHAVLIEDCHCPSGYIGLSCDVIISLNHQIFAILNVFRTSRVHLVSPVKRYRLTAIWAAAFLNHVSRGSVGYNYLKCKQYHLSR